MDYLKRVQQLLSNISQSEIQAVQKVLQEAISGGRRIFIAGNGGSAAIANHFATDLSVGTFRRTGKRIQAISLVENVSILTATANDLDYSSVFSEQLKVHATQGDVYFQISSSGNSRNLLKATQEAKSLDIEVVSLLGFDGGKLLGVSDYAIHVQSTLNDYGPVEDVHSICCHLLAERLREIS